MFPLTFFVSSSSSLTVSHPDTETAASGLERVENESQNSLAKYLNYATSHLHLHHSLLFFHHCLFFIPSLLFLGGHHHSPTRRIVSSITSTPHTLPSITIFPVVIIITSPVHSQIISTNIIVFVIFVLRRLLRLCRKTADIGRFREPFDGC